ncbi:hypothetical protein Nepgr_012282 [Nepenthes gracilis]|uniref:PWWP domain-containing protein n=1 Tax=Nepenthes gracilis TaxID=150966 RepID=A0AAD3XN56_NEPGR|nr:hypothetical protein Nepgr_012282 [Nepenthes gracilis]
MESMINNDLDMERTANATAADEELSILRGFNEEYVVGADERGEIGFTSSGDVSVNDLNRGESGISHWRAAEREAGEVRVSSGQNLCALESGVDGSLALPKPNGDIDARVFGRDGDRRVDGVSVDSGRISVCSEAHVANECMESRVPDINRIGEISERNVNDFDDQNSSIGNFGSTSCGNLQAGGGVTMGQRDVCNETSDESENGSTDKKAGTMGGADGDNRLQKPGSSRNDQSIMFYDGYVARDVAGGVSVGSLKVHFGFEMGDMVWGKVKSHPWWPGYIFNEAFASSSVLRTRRDGHVLVAFFGDSSYGWFEPAELIPYDPHYAEKSQQTNSRNFLKSLEESVDEVSRRSALSLSCRCRNPYNIRPTNVQGYFSVDVVDYEAGGIYSVSQIKTARDSFQSVVALSFIKQLAVAPVDFGSMSIEFIKNKSIALAYRRAIFEEFDETYAQAFGQQPVRPIRLPPSIIDQSVKDSIRAPLSGPLVFAEALGGQKSSTKAIKSKDHSRRDRGASVSAAGDCVFQRWHETVSVSAEQVSNSRRDETAAVGSTARGEAAGAGKEPVQVGRPKGQLMGPTMMDASNVTGEGWSLGASHDSWQFGLSVSRSGEETDGPGHVPDNHTGGHNAVHLGLAGGSGKKIKAAKCAVGELSSEKKRKIDATLSSDHLHEQPSTGNTSSSMGKLAGKPTLNVAALPRKDSLVSHQKVGGEGITSISEKAAQVRLSGGEKSEAELPVLFRDLQALALNPFHGAQRNTSAILKQLFLRFRSLVFQKSLAVGPSDVLERQEVKAIRTLAVAGEPVNTVAIASEKIRSVPLSKPLKPLKRPDDPVKVGQKHLSSELQEEIPAKKAKKIIHAKPSSSEKRVTSKVPEMQRSDGKGKVAVAPPPQPPPQRTAKADPVKRTVLPLPKAEEPTHLLMKYPPGTSLPSSNELKARFARFGPMHPQGNRIFYKTNTCRVTFLYKQDAEAAHHYAIQNKSVFANVRFLLKPVSASTPPDVSFSRGEDTTSEPSSAERCPVAPLLQLPSQPSVIQLKSILKKPSGDEGGQELRLARVRFNTGKESCARAVQLINHPMNSDSPRPSSMTLDVIPSVPLPRPHGHQFSVKQDAEVGPHQAPSLDISQSMLSLLMRCSDVVAYVESIYGYVPYHPL